MSEPQAIRLAGPDGKLIRGDRIEGMNRQILFITGLLSKRWGNKSKALAEWCQEQDWGFCCYDVRGFGDSEGTFTDYTLSDWIDDARAVVSLLQDGPRLTIVGNSLGGWFAWLMAQEFQTVDTLVLIAPAFKQRVTAGKTDAKPEVWQDWGKFEQAIADYEKAATALAGAAKGSDPAATGAAVKALGESCTGCHDSFRKPKEQSYKNQ